MRLDSSGFDQSVRNFGGHVGDIEWRVREFKTQVDRLIQAMGMHAENQCRADRGHAPAYDEEAFMNI